MTANQLQYWRNVETNRSNLAQEAETQRHNRLSEAISANTLVESRRHNLATEKETQRSNVANEGYKQRQNSIAEYNAQESARHNYAIERNDLMKASIVAKTAAQNRKSQENIAKSNRESNEIIASMNLGETARSNRVKEQLQKLNIGVSAVTSLLGTGVKALSSLAK